MRGVDVSSKIKELNKCKSITCNEDELLEYLNYGILIKTAKDKYITRSGKKIKVEVVKDKCYRLSINLSNLIKMCDDISNKQNEHRIFCMTQKTYDNYRKLDKIIKYKGKEYIKDNELWYIYKI